MVAPGRYNECVACEWGNFVHTTVRELSSSPNTPLLLQIEGMDAKWPGVERGSWSSCLESFKLDLEWEGAGVLFNREKPGTNRTTILFFFKAAFKTIFHPLHYNALSFLAVVEKIPEFLALYFLRPPPVDEFPVGVSKMGIKLKNKVFIIPEAPAMFIFLPTFKCIPSRWQPSGFIYSQNKLKTPAHTFHCSCAYPRCPPQGLLNLGSGSSPYVQMGQKISCKAEPANLSSWFLVRP